MRRLSRNLGLLTVFVALSARAGVMATERPGYEIAFASFAPLNSDIFVADADGSHARAFLPSPELDANASLSPDGQWVVFTSRRSGSCDIYRAHIDGSHLERLVADPAYDDQAALSPDGKSLAFVSSRSGDADIWILDLKTRRVRNLTNAPGGDFRPSWSPDGERIAFSSDRASLRPRVPKGDFSTRHSTEIYVVDVDGSGLRKITHDDAFAGSPSWSPDGMELTFYLGSIPELAKVTGARRLRGVTQIVLLDLPTGKRTVLTSREGEKWSPHWVSGRTITYVSGGPEGGVERVEGTAGARGQFNSPSWSSDGKHMVFHRDVDHAWPPHQAWPSLDPRFGLVRTGIFPSYAPDGERMISNDQTAGILHNSILMMNADGSAPAVFFSDPDHSALAPDWSRDGKHIAFGLGEFFQSIKGPAHADVATIDVATRAVETLTHGDGNYGFPSWSGDGKSIVFRSAGRERNGLAIVDVATHAVRTLVSGPAHYNFPTWSPAADEIAFTADIDGDYEIWSIGADGAGLKRLTTSPGNDAHNSWSPDGQWIAFTSARQGFKDEAMLHPANPQPYGEIYVMRADGSDAHALTDEPFEKGTPTWRPMSAKRRH